MANRFDHKQKKDGFFDYTLLTVTLFLALFGLVMIYSTSSVLYGTSYLVQQGLNMAIGIAVMLAIPFFWSYHFLGRFANLLVLFSIGTLLLLLTPIGITRNGATRWLNLGFFSFQPAEVCKLATILYFARVFTQINMTKINWVQVLAYIWAPALIMAAGLYFISDNMSSAIIVVGIAFCMTFISTPGYKRYIIFLLAVTAVAVAIIFYIDHQGSAGGFRGMRILAWLHPEQYSDSTAYQTVQALYAIGSGGFVGKGLGEGMQKLGYIPEAQNDMIFSIICEELGLFGALAVMVLFAVLIWRCMIIANNARDKFGSMIVVGVMSHIAIQVILNIAVVTNFIPNTGISLPFISYGGTSLIFLFAEIGLVLNVARNIEYKEIVRK